MPHNLTQLLYTKLQSHHDNFWYNENKQNTSQNPNPSQKPAKNHAPDWRPPFENWKPEGLCRRQKRMKYGNFEPHQASANHVRRNRRQVKWVKHDPIQHASNTTKLLIKHRKYGTNESEFKSNFKPWTPANPTPTNQRPVDSERTLTTKW